MNCQACGCYGDTRYVELFQNVGVLVMRFSKSIKGNLCRDCISKYFWELTLVTLFARWWGVISFIVTPFFLINNLYRFVSTRSLAPSAHPLGGSRQERLARLRGE